MFKKWYENWKNSKKESQNSSKKLEIVNTYNITYKNGNVFLLADFIPVRVFNSSDTVDVIVKAIKEMQESACKYKELT
jgi:hypothetical protein